MRSSSIVKNLLQRLTDDKLFVKAIVNLFNYEKSCLISL